MMKQFKLTTGHFNGIIKDDELEAGDFCDPEVEDIRALSINDSLTFDNGITKITRLEDSE